MSKKAAEAKRFPRGQVRDEKIGRRLPQSSDRRHRSGFLRTLEGDGVASAGCFQSMLEVNDRLTIRRCGLILDVAGDPGLQALECVTVGLLRLFEQRRR